MKLADHPTVKAYKEKKDTVLKRPNILEASWLKKVAIDAGADDIGVIDLARDSLAKYRLDLMDAKPKSKSIMSIDSFNI
jgi:hypothetical protein